jgi:hypothetical protein
MKTRISIIAIICGIAAVMTILFGGEFFQDISETKTTWGDAANLANKTASAHGIFPNQITWNVHIEKDGKIHALDGNHKIDKNLAFSCSFSIIPNDAKDHFAYLSVFRSDDAGYVVVLDEKTGQVIDAKPVQYESAVCGP